MDQQKILKGKFDIEIHKKNFINYLEILITKDGEILYGCPSHSEMLKKILIKELGEESAIQLLSKSFPIDAAEEHEICMIWTTIVSEKINNLQKIMLRILSEAGIYSGDVSEYTNLDNKDIFLAFGRIFNHSIEMQEKYKDDAYVKQQMFYINNSQDKVVINDALHRIGSYVCSEPLFANISWL